MSYGRREDDEYGTSESLWHENAGVRSIVVASGVVIGLWSLVIVLAVVTVVFS